MKVKPCWKPAHQPRQRTGIHPADFHGDTNHRCLENEDLGTKTQKWRPLEDEDLENEDPLENEDLENKDPLENEDLENEDPLENESTL